MTTINLTINAETPAELQKVLAGLTEAPVAATAPAKRKRKAEKASDAPKGEASAGSAKGRRAAENQPASSTEAPSSGGLQPDVTKQDVQAAMKEAIGNGHRALVLAAFERHNATKLSELDAGAYGAFLADLAALIGG